MSHRHDTYDWYDDDAFAAPAPVVPPAVAGLPESWWNYEWWMAGIAYAGLWLLESWTSGSSAVAGHMIWSLATLLLALACCYGLYGICAPYS
ncbi:MAG TPA: hypothetical protein VEZ16_07775 [Microvirga sp.]|nr:hypothetical protein [Microvirga sp.]